MVRPLSLAGLIGIVLITGAGAGEKPQPPKLWAGVSAFSPDSTSNAVFTVPETERLMIGFAVVNDGAAPVPFRRQDTELLINGRPLAGFGEQFGEGPVWPPLGPGKSYSAALGLGKHFARPGVYRVQWRGAGFASAVLQFRVVGEGGPQAATTPPGPAAPEGRVAWGKAPNGLQAGLAVRPADKHSFRVGETVRFVVTVRNGGDRPAEMLYPAVEPAARVGPSVLGAAGERPPLSGPAYSSVGGRATSKLALAPDQEVEFAAPELTFGAAGEPRVQEQAVVRGGPGRYRVSYVVYYLNPDGTANYFTTGEVDLAVAPPAAKP